MANKSDDVYVADHSQSVVKAHSLRTATESAAYLLPLIGPSMSILDIGCGPGTITADLAQLVPEGHVVGIDSGTDVIERARSMANARGLKNISFRVGDAHLLDFPDNSFDVVHGHQVLQHIRDPPLALREWQRVAKPGGIVACRESDWASAATYPEVEGVKEFLSMYATIARSRGGEPNGGRHLISWARTAGIKRSRIQASASLWCYSDPEERGYWSSMWADRIINSSFHRHALDAGVTKEELSRIAQAWQDWGTNEDGWWTITHGEIICRV